MAGKIQAGRNVTRLNVLHATIADMMNEAGYGCDGKPLKEASGEPMPALTAVELGEARTLLETVLVRSDSVDAKREALRQALREQMRARLKTPEDKYGPYVWIRDLFDDYFVYDMDDAGLYQVAYTADMGQTPPAITLGDPVEVEIAYVPKAMAVDTTEAALDVQFVPLVEAAITPDGTARLKLIDPGWGSSGYYSAEVLKRDGPRVFPAGLKMYLDHPTPTEEAERPERSVKDLAAVLKTTARWDQSGPRGPGLYAEAKVYDAHKDALESVAADIGVSIRAAGRAAPGTAEGRAGLIIQEISSAHSVDFVTDPGRGGRILALAESRRQQPTGGDPKSKEKGGMQLTESEKKLQGDMAALTETVTQLAGAVKGLVTGAKLSEARAFVRQHLPASMPEAVAARIVEAQAANAPTREDGTIDAEAYVARVKEAVKTEVDYLRGLGALGSGVTGMGEAFAESGGSTPTAEDSQKLLAESFRDLGMSEQAAKAAAEGR